MATLLNFIDKNGIHKTAYLYTLDECIKSPYYLTDGGNIAFYDGLSIKYPFCSPKNLSGLKKITSFTDRNGILKYIYEGIPVTTDDLVGSYGSGTYSFTDDTGYGFNIVVKGEKGLAGGNGSGGSDATTFYNTSTEQMEIDTGDGGVGGSGGAGGCSFTATFSDGTTIIAGGSYGSGGGGGGGGGGVIDYNVFGITGRLFGWGGVGGTGGTYNTYRETRSKFINKSFSVTISKIQEASGSNGDTGNTGKYSANNYAIAGGSGGSGGKTGNGKSGETGMDSTATFVDFGNINIGGGVYEPHSKFFYNNGGNGGNGATATDYKKGSGGTLTSTVSYIGSSGGVSIYKNALYYIKEPSR